MSRPVLVVRLLEDDAHVSAGVQVGGVTVRTVWRWLEAARTESRVERRPLPRLELSDQAWEVLAQTGGNVSVLHRRLVLAAVDPHVDRDVLAEQTVREEQQRRALADFLGGWDAAGRGPA
ncbi:hypothetical protein [Streptomyces yerevanensis]|uniref:hypothetical protein n=1 Tax=Streptomyces yerevanensis TaxID=66378 RepID=UPI001FDF0367|nr:hypothetical protein [Streptomyces yerevanensis]